ncbi:hypothetical protein HSBAA_36650 [Vreelandella sulfidaeris]|uniref:Uncharacterized protein n=1 Tax=Vreelandella sulfidaeris TaxID=115553 RepID=A0A455UD45_9GAMM|nr:hypothetical protein HSBAA_36650 [Halomonas sulfidaeris]
MQPSVDYSLLNRQLEALLDTRDWLTNTAQTCAFIQQQLSDLNWVGFTFSVSPMFWAWGPSKVSLPATRSPSAKAYAVRPLASKRLSEWTTYMRLPTTLPATPTLARSSWCQL